MWHRRSFFCREMSLAIRQAKIAGRRGEVPVGAVLLDEDGHVLARRGNAMRQLRDPSAHAEMLVMREAVRLRDGQKLDGCTLIVTLEPCPMCAAAILEFRIHRLIFGAYDPKGGGVEHNQQIFSRHTQSTIPDIIGGVRESENKHLLKEFFKKLRT